MLTKRLMINHNVFKYKGFYYFNCTWLFYTNMILLFYIFYDILLDHFTNNHGYPWLDTELHREIDPSETKYEILSKVGKSYKIDGIFSLLFFSY